MNDLVLDTHALIWYLETSPRLSAVARKAIKATLSAGGLLHVPSVYLAEIVHLEEKGRIVPGTFGKVTTEMSRPGTSLIDAPFTAGVARAMAGVSRQLVPDLPDRMIAGTAIHLGLPLVTADHRIRSSGIATIW